MPSDDDVLSVIERIYEAALDPSLWADVLRTIGSLVFATQASLFLHTSDTVLLTDLGYGRNEEAKHLYNTKYVSADPWGGALARVGPGRVVTGQQLQPTRTYENSDYYKDVMESSEIYDCLAVLLENNPGFNAVAVFNRPKSVDFFGDHERRILAKFVPHLQRAVEIRRRFEGNAVIREIQSEALDKLSFGVLILGRIAGLRYANRAAEEILRQRDGLTLTQNRLSAIYQADNVKLLRAQERALGFGFDSHNEISGSTISVRRRSMARPYSLQIIPIGQSMLERLATLSAYEPMAIVAITDPSVESTPTRSVLMHAFGLTPTEADLAMRIGSGDSVKQAAELMGMREQTARWHMKNILSKTETSRQTELISLLSRIAAPLA